MKPTELIEHYKPTLLNLKYAYEQKNNLEVQQLSKVLKDLLDCYRISLNLDAGTNDHFPLSR